MKGGDFMKSIVFIDVEVSNEKVVDYGAIYDNDKSFHNKKEHKFSEFISDAYYICGHNIISHDSKYISKSIRQRKYVFIDTLRISPLIYPKKKYHNLLKDDRLQTDSVNNPLNDSIKAKDLFFEEVASFNALDTTLKSILGTLLFKQKEFEGFFEYVSWNRSWNVVKDIKKYFYNKICDNSQLAELVSNNPIELAYTLALVACDEKYESFAPWVHVNYSKVEMVIDILRGHSCGECEYCRSRFNPEARLKEIFNYDSFRKFGDNEEPLQEIAVKAALEGESILTIFPTGGGKSVTFQLPALIASETTKGLTVVISPLQSLMKDQVDGLLRKNIIDAVTINGMVNPIERKEAIDRIYDGRASLLYIAPESLRSKTILKLLLSRKIERIVIDEAHCFSTWGQDFRIDYLYIGKFINDLQKAKGIGKRIPISCFTATAKQKVISDILDYFNKNLGLRLRKIATTATRKNLHYKVEVKRDDDEKYSSLRELLLTKKCPTIIYVATTTLAMKLADKLKKDGIETLYFHGKMQSQEKVETQNKFINGEVNVIVATSAFGMGVDKDNVELVIHFEISDSLENYVQEAGRAGRSEKIEAECIIYYNEDDLNKHFGLLNRSKVNIGDIQKVYQGIKKISANRPSFSCTALELARASGWDDELEGVETLIKTAINALEDAEYIKRGMNSPRVFATSINVANVNEAVEKMQKTALFDEKEVELSRLIISRLIGTKRRSMAGNDEAESRVDYLADTLGVEKTTVMNVINKMKQINILKDENDMNALVKLDKNKLFAELERLSQLELYMINKLGNTHSKIDLKKFNSDALNEGIKRSTVKNIKTVLLYWTLSKLIKKTLYTSDNAYEIEWESSNKEIIDKVEKRLELARFIAEYLVEKIDDKKRVEFSLVKLLNVYNNRNDLFSSTRQATLEEIQSALMYLSKLSLLSIEGGFLVLYNAMQIERLQMDNKILYKKEDYKKLEEHYAIKVAQIHMVGEYANMMVRDPEEALLYVKDYFELEYDMFIAKYFRGIRRKEIRKKLTPQKYQQIFGNMSQEQLKIIDDDENQYITVLAGPGSGKTRVLVHKLASLLLLEDIKTEQLLMLTFSRASALEFKERLIGLIGHAAYYVDIKTFHSYCFDLLGTLGDETLFDKEISDAMKMIENGEVEQSKIAKSVLVIDEAQDMTEEEYQLITMLIEHNPEMKVIAVGDDDQNIYEFRKASSEYFKNLLSARKNSYSYNLLTNYRSVKRVIDFSNEFVKNISGRMKNKPATIIRKDAGDVSIIQFEHTNLELPIVNHLKKTIKRGETNAILTQTNIEAFKIMGLLRKEGIPAKLIQNGKDFKLYHLCEIREFINRINNGEPVVLDSVWQAALEFISERYKKSENLSLVLNILNRYRKSVKTVYFNDLKTVFLESNISDFEDYSNTGVVVSTVHKSKGHEFDNVYLMVYDMSHNNETYRKLYVGITRAKNNLYLYTNTNFFEKYKNIVKYMKTSSKYAEPEELLIELSHTDINLGNFKYGNVSKVVGEYSYCGQKLIVKDDWFYINNIDLRLFVFSKNFREGVYLPLLEKGYSLIEAKVNYVVKWHPIDEVDFSEYNLILPSIRLAKNKTTEDNKCPLCNGALIIRQGKKGAFFGCSNYPKCTYTKNLEE